MTPKPTKQDIRDLYGSLKKDFPHLTSVAVKQAIAESAGVSVGTLDGWLSNKPTKNCSRASWRNLSCDFLGFDPLNPSPVLAGMLEQDRREAGETTENE